MHLSTRKKYNSLNFYYLYKTKNPRKFLLTSQKSSNFAAGITKLVRLSLQENLGETKLIIIGALLNINIMKRILDIFDYIFYRIHKFVLAHPKMIVSDGAPYIFSFIIQLMPLLLIIVPVVRMYGINIHRYSLGWYIFMAVLVAAQYPIWKRYENPTCIKELEERWDNEVPEKKKIRGLLVDLLIINNLIFIPVFLCILTHYNII